VKIKPKNGEEIMEATKKNADKVYKAIRGNVETLLIAKAFAMAERERVDAIERQVLAEQLYYADGERVTDPKKSYRMDETTFAAYYAKVQAIHVKNGYADAANGYCPALVAEDLQRKAEHALIEQVREFFPNVTVNSLLCCANGLERYKKFIDLLIGLVVNHPTFKAPKLPRK
jgi:hypothetical protein